MVPLKNLVEFYSSYGTREFACIPKPYKILDCDPLIRGYTRYTLKATAQTFQNPLIKAYTLKNNRIPNMI